MAQKVVDASVALKWALPEAGHQECRELLRQFITGEHELIAPRILMEEVASALSRSFRQKRLNAEQANQALAWIEKYKPTLFDQKDLRADAFSLSLRHQISFWDSLYLAVAIRHRCDLVTADRRLYRALTPHYPFVSLLGS